MNNLFDRIDAALTKISHGWTSSAEAHAMAAAVLALRPALSVEIGVYAGKGLVTLGMAHKEVGRGRVVGIDPYLPYASADGQLNPEDKVFWATLDHEAIYRMCLENLGEFKLHDCVTLTRAKSCDVKPPKDIGVLRVDGNHGEAAVSDVARYAPNVIIGGLLFLDDLNWTGGAVLRAAAKLRQDGWRELYRVDDGAVFQRVK